MREYKNCKIVQDLLPNYIENLTDVETNQYIEEHISNCEKCKTVYENMKQDLQIYTKKSEEKEIDGFKKYNKRLKFFKISLFLIILILLLTFCITTGRKMIIIYNLYNKAKEYENSNNYHITEYRYDNGTFTKYETFVMGDQIKMQDISIDGENITKTISIGNKGKSENDYTSLYELHDYIEEYNKKSAILNSKMTGIFGPTNLFYTENILDLFKSAVKTSIKEKNIKGKKCYYIDSLTTNEIRTPQKGIYINKETGLLEYTNESENYIYEKLYEFDVVTKDDFIEPDISDYTIYNTPQEYVYSLDEND